jgi:hypothetical protein
MKASRRSGAAGSFSFWGELRAHGGGAAR